MKTSYIIFFLWFCFCQVNGQTSDTISIGKIDSINSEILGEKRELWIHVPDGNYDHALNDKKYPVLYLLDGNANFYSVVGMVRQMSSVNGNTMCPKMIIVGISNTNRMRDLSPSKASTLNGKKIEDSGGGDTFISFIENELIPYIDSNYPTESYRVFVGHSLGGLTVMNTLIHNPELFNSYIAIDPSMWWNNEHLLNKIKQIKLDKKYKNRSLFLGIANTMTKGMDTIKVKKDTTYTTRHIRALLKLNEVLQKDTLNNIAFKGKYYEQETHGSVALITEYDALRYIFDFYQLKIKWQDFMNPENDILDIIEKRYKRISKEFGREIKPERMLIENIAYRYMDMQQFEKAEDFFKLNVTNYPKDFAVYNALGYFYIAIKNKDKAIEIFKKSLILNSDSDAKDQLDVLLKE